MSFIADFLTLLFAPAIAQKVDDVYSDMRAKKSAYETGLFEEYCENHRHNMRLQYELEKKFVYGGFDDPWDVIKEALGFEKESKEAIDLYERRRDYEVQEIVLTPIMKKLGWNYYPYTWDSEVKCYKETRRGTPKLPLRPPLYCSAEYYFRGYDDLIEQYKRMGY